jgi:hypothetical protein
MNPVSYAASQGSVTIPTGLFHGCAVAVAALPLTCQQRNPLSREHGRKIR